MGTRGKKVFEEQAGATQRAVDAVMRLLTEATREAKDMAAVAIGAAICAVQALIGCVCSGFAARGEAYMAGGECGNLSVGGAGKTPFVIALRSRFRRGDGQSMCCRADMAVLRMRSSGVTTQGCGGSGGDVTEMSRG